MENWRQYKKKLSERRQNYSARADLQQLKTWQKLDPENEMSAEEYEKHLDSLSDEEIVGAVDVGVDLEKTYSKDQLVQFVKKYSQEPDPVGKQKIVQSQAAPLKKAINDPSPGVAEKALKIAHQIAKIATVDRNNVDQAEEAVVGLINALPSDGYRPGNSPEDLKDVLGGIFNYVRKRKKAAQRKKRQRGN